MAKPRNNLLELGNTSREYALMSTSQITAV